MTRRAAGFLISLLCFTNGVWIPLSYSPSYLAPATVGQGLPVATAIEIKKGYESFCEGHRRITAAAKARFERRKWEHAIDASVARTYLFDRAVERCVENLKRLDLPQANPETVWREIKDKLNRLFAEEYDADLALTFFYGARRKYFENQATPFQFVDEPYLIPRERIAPENFLQNYPVSGSLQDAVVSALKDKAFEVPYKNLDFSAEQVSQLIKEHLIEKTGSPYCESIQMLKPVFFRNKGAYLFGKIDAGGGVSIPLVLQLRNFKKGVRVRAVISEPDEVRNLLGYSVSSFFVDTPWHREVVDFLTGYFDDMDRAAVYNAIGYESHAKTVLFEEIHKHTEETGEQHDLPREGVEGKVMLVFGKPTLRYVFKVIKDQKVITENTRVRTKEGIVESYEMIGKMDRVGRMLNSIEYRDWKFKKKDLTEDLLADLRAKASDNIIETEEEVVVKHLYLQRKVIPMVVYINTQPPEKVRKALIDWGYCIRDLAAAGIYMNDIGIHNFGVTTSGKVICYDFDSVNRIDRFIFKNRPQKSRKLNLNDPWDDYLYLMEGGDDDPEPYLQFDGAIWPDYGQIRTVEYWLKMQSFYKGGRHPSFYPFPRNRLLRRNGTRQLEASLLSPRSDVQNRFDASRGVAPESAAFIRESWCSYMRELNAITKGAKNLFENKTWMTIIQNSKGRYDLFPQRVSEAAAKLKERYPGIVSRTFFWEEMKEAFQREVKDFYDIDFAYTFFYAVRREVFAGRGNPFRFVDEAYLVKREHQASEPVYWEFSRKENESSADLLKRIMSHYPFSKPFQHVEAFAAAAQGEIDKYLIEMTGSPHYDSIEILKPLFYRNQGAYVVGRIQSGGVKNIPLVIPVEHVGDHLQMRAVLMNRDEVRNIFGYSVSSFFVNTPWHRETVDFLVSLFDRMERAAMYKTIGYHHHARTVLYKEMSEHAEESGEKFELAPGEEGSVMSVFTLPGLRYVFKMIKNKDRIGTLPERHDPTKRQVIKTEVTKEKVIEQYHKVNKLDRVGRLLEAIDYQKLSFKKSVFSPEVLTHLRENVSESMEETEDEIILYDVFVQRKTIPLDIYVRTQDPLKVRKALLDLGHLLRDLAKAGIFINDMMIKNFGVTSTGKVVLYDFDDVENLLDFTFRPLPINYAKANEEFDPSYGYDPYMMEGTEDSYSPPSFTLYSDFSLANTVYPDQVHFFGIPPEHLNAWNAIHGELRTAYWWGTIQDQIKEGYVVRFYPFSESRLLTFLDQEKPRKVEPQTTTDLAPPTKSIRRAAVLEYLSQVESAL